MMAAREEGGGMLVVSREERNEDGSIDWLIDLNPLAPPPPFHVIRMVCTIFFQSLRKAILICLLRAVLSHVHGTLLVLRGAELIVISSTISKEEDQKKIKKRK